MNNKKGSYWRSLCDSDRKLAGHGLQNGGRGGGRGCSETGVQQQKLKQNWLVVSKPSVTGDCHYPLLVGCKVTVTLLAVCSRTRGHLAAD